MALIMVVVVMTVMVMMIVTVVVVVMMIVIEVMPVPVIMVIMVVMVSMIVAVIMIVIMPVIMMMDTLVRTAPARVLAEQQRLDRDRHGERRHPDAAEIDVVEIAQHHPVDRQDLALDQQLLTQDGAQGLGDVAVEHDVERLPAGNSGGEAAAARQNSTS